MIFSLRGLLFGPDQGPGGGQKKLHLLCSIFCSHQPEVQTPLRRGIRVQLSLWCSVLGDTPAPPTPEGLVLAVGSSPRAVHGEHVMLTVSYLSALPFKKRCEFCLSGGLCVQ